MAPPKTPRKKNIPNASTPQSLDFAMGNPSANEDQPGRSPMAAQPADTYAKAQEDEREVLKAIFMEDLEEVEAKGAWSVRVVFLFLFSNFPSISMLSCHFVACPTMTHVYPQHMQTCTDMGRRKLQTVCYG
jgi:translation initiation factor 2-alpha kinase 4